MDKVETETVGVILDTNDSLSRKISGLSSRNAFNAIANRFFNSASQELTDAKKTTVIHVAPKKHCNREKPKNDEKQMEKSNLIFPKTGKQYLVQSRLKGSRLKQGKQIDRDLRRFKAKYNSSIGNIVRDWMSLIYCILILRMNLIEFILKYLPDQCEAEVHLHRQIMLESKIMFNMIRNAQNSSQDKFIYLWTNLERLIFNRKLFRNGLQTSLKDIRRDWKSADEKLSELQTNFHKTNDEYKALQQSKLEAEISGRNTLSQLEKVISLKDAEYNDLVDKIRELQKREVQMRGKILINMKSYKNLKAKKQKLAIVEEKMQKMKMDQMVRAGEYKSKIQSLKKEIEESEKQIKEEKEEKKAIKAGLEGFGDYSEKPL